MARPSTGAKKTAKTAKAAKAAKSPAETKPPARKKRSSKKKAAPTVAPPAERAKAKSPFPPRWLAQQEKALREERATYTRQADSLRAEADSLVADFEPGDVQFDEESGEGDTLNTERERDLALSAQAGQAVEEIDRALAKMAEGTYGICEVSGEPIPKERLEAIPWARERVEYKTGGLGRR
jgi:RNA polymerase-binding transcription factor DksA